MVRSYDKDFDSKPAQEDHPINLADLKDILGKAIKEPATMAELLRDPQKTLKDMNYAPHPEAVDFFKALAGTDFAKAADTFKPAHDDPTLGMAEA